MEINSVSQEKLLKISMPSNNDYRLMIIDLPTYRSELENAKFEESIIDCADYSTFDPNLTLQDVSDFKTNLGLLIAGPFENIMEPDYVIHEIAYNNLIELLKLDDNAISSDIKNYLRKLIKLCDKNIVGTYAECEEAFPGEKSQAILKDSWRN